MSQPRDSEPRGLRPLGQLDARLADEAALGRLDANFDQFADWAGGGVGPWAYTIGWPRGRVLHATVDKTHSFVGYQRYTADHRAAQAAQAA